VIIYYTDIGHTHWHGTLAEAKKAARDAAELDGSEVTVEKVKIATTKAGIVNLANQTDCAGDVVYVAKPRGK
jgi:hypothetical protein